MKVLVRYFAAAREAAGTDQETLACVPGTSVDALARRLVEGHPALAPFVRAARFAVDEEFASPDTVLRDGQTVAWIPPVSGG